MWARVISSLACVAHKTGPTLSAVTPHTITLIWERVDKAHPMLILVEARTIQCEGYSGYIVPVLVSVVGPNNSMLPWLYTYLMSHHCHMCREYIPRPGVLFKRDLSKQNNASPVNIPTEAKTVS